MRIRLAIKKSIPTLLFPFFRLKEIFNSAGSVRILVYHSIGDRPDHDTLGLRISSKVFRRQMQDLKDWGYEIIDIDTIFKAPMFLAETKKRYVVLTFDDGYRDFMSDALPILKDFGYPATLFVTIEYLQGRRRQEMNDYWENWDKMSWADLKAVKMNKQIRIGSHGYSHKILNQLSDEEMQKEVFLSKNILENELGEKIDFFAYPHGLYNKSCQAALKEAGYKAAFTGRPGLFGSLTDIYAIKRTEISYYQGTRLEFRKKINGSYDWTAFKSAFIK